MPPTPPQPVRPARRSRQLNAMLAAVLALLLGALLAIWLANWTPGFYAMPATRDRQKLLDDAFSFSRRVQDFISYNILSERAEPIEITDDEVNGYLAAVNDKDIWERLPFRFESWRREFTSDWLRDVQVKFSEGRVTVAGMVTWHDLDVVLSVSGRPEVDPDGQARLHVTSIRAGRLPLPKFLFRDFLKDVDDRPLPAKISRWRLKAVEITDGKARLIGQINGSDK